MNNVVVVGAGTMGAGIALCAARAGWSVDLVEPDDAARTRTPQRLQNEAERCACSGAVRSVHVLDAIERSAPATLAIEAVPERFDVKQGVFRQLADHLGAEAILASNTSSLPVSSLANCVPNPQRVIGLHFFNPPLVMKLVEIVRTEKTEPLVIDIAEAFVRNLGKTGVVTGDAPGFIVNRVARPFYLQAMRALEDGVASVEDIDALARGAGFRMGPFELMDLIGLDVNLATSESIYERTGFRRLAPVEMQRQMVAQNKLGRKTKAGFYSYAETAEYTQKPTFSQWDRPKDQDEDALVLSAGGRAREYYDAATRGYRSVTLLEDDELIANVDPATSIVIDVPLSYDGARLEAWQTLESAISEEAIVCVDAYAGDFRRLAEAAEHPGRFVGFGVIGSLADQSVVEIVAAEWSSQEALFVAEDFFARCGKQTRRIEYAPGLYLGLTVCSIINEALYAFSEGVASRDDIELAMQLATNYPMGPFAWAIAIGPDRVARILDDVARVKGLAYASAPMLPMLGTVDAQNELDTAYLQAP